MKTKIIEQKKNQFLGREEFILQIENEVSPTFDEVKAELGRDVDLTVVKKVNSNFGRKIFLIEVVVYDNAEVRERVEVIPQKVRKKMAADKKAEEEARKKAEEAAAKEAEEAKNNEQDGEEAE